MTLSANGHNSTLHAIGDEIARNLAASKADMGSVFITTPLLYPSGSSVVVRIEGSRDKFFVTDFGAGYAESQMMNASHGYSMVANNLARGTGVRFDSRSFFVAEAMRNDLIPIVGATANLSQRAVIETAFQHEERRVDRERAILLERLDHAFGRQRVERDIEIRGASTVEWPVIARIVSCERRATVFDIAKRHKNSIASVVAKFHDLARLEIPPCRVVAVNSVIEMGNFVGLLSQAANVIELPNATDEVLLKLAA
ncbi:MAG: hypothetical protein ACREFD_04850 [Stellaceae bacterium]